MTMHVHDLTVGLPAADAPTVIAVHGITGNGLNWSLLGDVFASRLGHGAVRLLAPDLNGRGDSPVRPGPLGLDVHVHELAALARTLPSPPLVLGHSMGAAVAVLFAAAYPELVSDLVLVDGGLNFPVPPGMGDEDIDKALRVVLGPAMKRLERSFESPEAYIEFVADHPAVGPLVHGPDAEHILRYLHHDVRPSPTEMGRFVSSCVLAAIRADGRDVMFHPRLSGAIRDVVSKGVPVDFLWAPRGLFDEKQGLYDDNRLSILKVPGEVAVTLVPDTNHYSIVLSRPGLAPVIDTVLRRLRL
jgi:pimeloyl-ACP methyl ester carboxylesterase